MFYDFMLACAELDSDSFVNTNKRFQISIFDAVFYVLAKKYLANNNFNISKEKFDNMRDDQEFQENTEQNTTNTATVKKRIEIADRFLAI